jgi:hypothetical protein
MDPGIIIVVSLKVSSALVPSLQSVAMTNPVASDPGGNAVIISATSGTIAVR